MVLGSFKRITFCSKVLGYSKAFPFSGFLNLFQISRLMISVLMLQRGFLIRALSILLIIIIQQKMRLNGLLALSIFMFLLTVFAADKGEEMDILRFWNLNASSSHSHGDIPRTLFVSSWSKQGRKYAIQFAKKFQAIILCLYDLRFEDRQFFLQKLVEIQPTFTKDLRAANPKIRIILRIFVSSSAKSIFEYVSSSTKKISDLSVAIVKTMRKQKANGIFYDSLFNLPLKITTVDHYGPYDKFAILLNSYITNRIKEEITPKERLYYGVKIGDWKLEDVDFSSLRLIKANGFIVEAIDNSQADLSMMRSLSFARQISNQDANLEVYITIPLFSWRNGIGMKTSTVQTYIERNKISYRGYRSGLCIYVQQRGGAESNVPCDHYYQIVRKYAQDFNLKLAFFEAGDALERQFQLI